jgi:23S rRNA-/tRNA-specific pseudouridylate synthase
LEDGPYPVHRLDKVIRKHSYAKISFSLIWQGTTGSLILARTLSMARELSQQFQKRTVEKTYLALVRGGAQSFSSTHGQVCSAIQYNDGRASLDHSNLGKHSVTDWELACSSVCFFACTDP